MLPLLSLTSQSSSIRLSRHYCEIGGCEGSLIKSMWTCPLTLWSQLWPLLSATGSAALCELCHSSIRLWLPMAGLNPIQHKNHLRVVLNSLCWNCGQAGESWETKRMATTRVLEFSMAKASALFKEHCSPNKKLRNCSLQNLDHKMARAMWQAKEKQAKRLKGHYFFETASQNNRQ